MGHLAVVNYVIGHQKNLYSISDSLGSLMNFQCFELPIPCFESPNAFSKCRVSRECIQAQNGCFLGASSMERVGYEKGSLVNSDSNHLRSPRTNPCSGWVAGKSERSGEGGKLNVITPSSTLLSLSQATPRANAP